MKRLAAVILLLLGFLLAGLISLPFTTAGTKTLIGLVNRIDFLDIGPATGHLAGELALEHVRVTTETLSIDISSVRTSLDPACLWRSAVCLSSLGAGELTVVLAHSAETDPTEVDAKELLSWPVTVEVESLDIGQVRVEWPGGHWHQAQLSGRVLMYDSVLKVEGGRLHDARLLLEGAEDEGERSAPLALPEIFLPMDLQLQGLAVVGLEADIGGTVESLRQLELSGHWQGYGLALESLAVSSYRGDAELQGQLDFRDDWPAEITAQIAQLSLLDYGNHQFSLQLSGSLGKANLQLQGEGPMQVSADVDVDILTPGVPFKAGVTLSLAEGQRPAEIFSLPDELSDLEMSSPVIAHVEGTLSQQLFALEAQVQGLGYTQLQLHLEGSHREGRAQLNSLLLTDQGTDTALQATGHIDYGEGLLFGARFDSAGVALPLLDAGFTGRVAGTGELSGQIDSGQWQLQVDGLDLHGKVNDLPATLSGHALVHAGGRFGDTRLQGRLNGAELKLEGAPDEGASILLQVDEFARWSEDAHGGLYLTATRPVDSDRFTIAGELLQPAYGAIAADGGRISGYLSETLQAFDLAIDLIEPSYGEVKLDTFHLAASGGLAAHQISLRTEGEISGALNLSGEMLEGQWRGSMAPARFDTRHGQWQLVQAVALQWQVDEGALSVQAHCWQHPALALCLEQAELGAVGKIHLKAQGNLSALNGLLPADLELAGALDASLDASWAADKPLRLNGVGHSQDVSVTRHYGLGDAITIGWDSLSTQVQANEDGLKLQAQMERGGRRVLAMDVALPPERDQALAGRILLEELQLQTMAPWAPELSRLEGLVNGDLQLSGTLDAPRLSGPLSLTEGNLLLVGNPTEVTGLSLEARMEGEHAEITGSALLGGGELQLEGQLQVVPDLQLKLNVSGERHQILVPPSTELVVSEELALIVTPGLIDVSGEIRILEGVLHHEQLPAGSVGLSSDVIEVDLAGNPLRQKSRWDIRSDVWVRLHDHFKISGDSLSATIGGDLHLRQGVGKPLQLFGNLNVLGGELRAFRQQLIIRRGTVAFSGPPGNPELDVRAERQLREQAITVGASLQGRLDAPRLDVYSDPPMSQGEAMSYLVRGRGLDSGAGADGTALALAMGANVVNQSGILSPINRLPGISNVSFGSSGTDDDTAATVSGYLGERIYLSYGIGLYEPINVLTARFYLQARLWVEVVSRLENSVDIYYSFDID